MIIKKNFIAGTVLGLVLGCSASIVAQSPVVNIGDRHGNLRSAQEYIVAAWQKIDAAQVDNRYNLGGHAGRAKQLLMQADEQLRLAADVANRH